MFQALLTRETWSLMVVNAIQALPSKHDIDLLASRECLESQQQRTSIEALSELPPGVPIAGFIFHMSRCGSTLLSQALAAFESNIVVSEAAPLRSILPAAGGRSCSDGVVAPAPEHCLNIERGIILAN